ncbi:hypothetical protein JOC37_001202 [Desulfohalotomaculum tongense]|uniref:hypothetical protein n=1 Tax=Desulforadius tongensis TaxID=1216062 RepID=UPI00195EC986|nr:hypothetical protein [Desulforadius tongensis]MBM7854824.1 hypothetical protein [Desulforadius tongensis]
MIQSVSSVSRKQPLLTANRRLIKIRRVKLNLVDRAAAWLEAEDTDLAKISAYAVCLLSGLVITGRVLELLIK